MPEPVPEEEIESMSRTAAIIRAATRNEVGYFFTHVWKNIYREGNLPALLDWDRLPACDEFFVAECAWRNDWYGHTCRLEER